MAREVQTNGVQIATVEPPPRSRERKITLSAEVLDALTTALGTGAWVGNSVTYKGKTGNKDAQTEARIYRRDLARHLNITERNIRTRVWGSDSDGYMFALKRREADK